MGHCIVARLQMIVLLLVAQNKGEGAEAIRAVYALLDEDFEEIHDK